MEKRKESSGGSGYGKPPWRFKGRAVFQLHLVPSQVARALIPKDLQLVQAFGYTLGGFFLANYDDTPAGPFDELVVIAGIVWNPPTSCAWASKVLVNSNEACLHGRSYVGLPSHVARFSKLRCCPEQVTANKEPQTSRFSRLLSKFCLHSTSCSSKFNLETQVTELDGAASTEEIFRINILSSAPKEDSEPRLGPHIKMSLPSFSGRTHCHASLLKYSCQMECRVRIAYPLRISMPSPATDLRTEQQAVEDHNSSSIHQAMEETKASRSTLSLKIMLAKPILALEFDHMSMNVEAPLIISG